MSRLRRSYRRRSETKEPNPVVPPTTVFNDGDVTKVKIISIIPEERKLGLSIKRVGSDDDDYSYEPAAAGPTTIGDLVREKFGDLKLS